MASQSLLFKTHSFQRRGQLWETTVVEKMNTGDRVEMTWPFFPEHPEPMGEGAKVSPDAKGDPLFGLNRNRFGFLRELKLMMVSRSCFGLCLSFGLSLR